MPKSSLKGGIRFFLVGGVSGKLNFAWDFMRLCLTKPDNML